MLVNGKKFDPMQAILDAKTQRTDDDLKKTQEIERLKLQIMVDWDQVSSSGFWKKCFDTTPFEIIKKNFTYITTLEKTGYAVKNPAALFVTLMKKQGHFPFKEVIRNV